VAGCTTTSISKTSIILIYVITLSDVKKLVPVVFVSVNANATVCCNFKQYNISLKIGGLCLRNILYFFKKQEFIGGCRKLHCENLHNLHPEPSIITST
jgi:hypothetical protein